MHDIYIWSVAILVCYYGTGIVYGRQQFWCATWIKYHMQRSHLNCYKYLTISTGYTTNHIAILQFVQPSPQLIMVFYPMLRADSRFWLVNNREIWSRISRLTSSAWDIKTKERHWWRHNGDSDRRPLSLPLRYDLVTLCLYDDLGQINVIAGILKLRKRFRMSQILFEHGINSLPLVCFRGYGNLSTLSIAIPRLAFGRAWYCDAACG